MRSAHLVRPVLWGAGRTHNSPGLAAHPAPKSRRPRPPSGGGIQPSEEAAMPEEYTLRLEASGEVTPAQPDTDIVEPEPEEAEQ